MGALLETEALECRVDRAGGRAGGGCGVLGALVETETVEQRVLFWRRRLFCARWIGRAVGRAVGLAAGGRAGGFGFHETSSGCSLVAGSVEFWSFSWRRGLWCTGCSLGHEGC